MTTMRDWNELYTRYLRKQCSPDEVRLLLEHFRLEGGDSELRSRVRSELADTATPVVDTPEVAAAFDRIRHRLMARVTDEATGMVPRARWLRWLPYAAAVLVMALAGIWFFGSDQFDNREPIIVNAEDIGPGGNRATLTLVDGRTIDLSSGHEGIVVDDGGITYHDGSFVLDTKDKKLVSKEDQQRSVGAVIPPLMAITTPKGGTYQITLSDGTNVWLNAASTLKYPSRFSDNERVVELEGEAYFEVRQKTLGSRQQTAENRKNNLDVASSAGPKGASNSIPFKVVSKGQVVEVLGTQFNISAYADESVIKTTLVEGSVNVIHSLLQTGAGGMGNGIQQPQEMLLKPGEQAHLTNIGIQKRKVDVEQFIAWKDGLFSFNETELHAAMNQLSRWYDIAITYHNEVPSTHYYGAISRNESLASVLELLQQSGLNFKIEKVQDGNKLTVLP